MALFGAGDDGAGAGPAELVRDLLAVGLGGVLLDVLPGEGALLDGPLGALLLGGVALGDLVALDRLLLHAVRDVVLDGVLVIPKEINELNDGCLR